ncbi:MAG: aminotransferase class V-fold PLP-dependent enzyme [Coriobacteriales bacterium]|jgi:cysteine desulfurase family protein|nr:aminotransferase class V-fold PLP-dependent enzyme [Coriobacteriales bacterium]
MQKLYFDNASTSFPKPPGVAKAVVQYIEDVGCNLDRSGYGTSCVLNRKTRYARSKLAELFNVPDLRQVVFMPSITYALNLVIKGLFKRGDHVLVSSMEHNAVTRPLFQLRREGVAFDFIPCNSKGELDPADVKPCIRPTTRAIVTLHASNVCGTVLPIREIGAIARENELLYIVDSAQSAGVLPINMERDHISILCFAAHKGLLGPPGVGGLIIPPELASRISPLVVGGTGVMSELDEVPAETPMRFESGTPNLMGYYGLAASLAWIQRQGISRIHDREMENWQRLLHGVQQIDGLRIHGTQDPGRSVSVLAVDAPGLAIGKIAWRLDNHYHIITRCGLHCAPWANRTLGSFPEGTIRLSPGYFTRKRDIDTVLAALEESLAYVRRSSS